MFIIIFISSIAILLRSISLFLRFQSPFFLYNLSAYHKQTGKTLRQLSKDKGALGEYLTYAQLRFSMPIGTKYLFNAYLPTSKDAEVKKTEADIIVITKKGIIVIENKCYSGFITVSGDSWCQWFGKNKFPFYSPISQNQTHINAFRKNCTGKWIPAFGIVVFSDKAKLSNTVRHMHGVTQTKRVAPVTWFMLFGRRKCLTNKGIREIWKAGLKYCNANKREKDEHIDEIDKKIKKMDKEEGKHEKQQMPWLNLLWGA